MNTYNDTNKKTRYNPFTINELNEIEEKIKNYEPFKIEKEVEGLTCTIEGRILENYTEKYQKIWKENYIVSLFKTEKYSGSGGAIDRKDFLKDIKGIILKKFGLIDTGYEQLSLF